MASWRNSTGLGAMAALCLLLPACESGGHFTVLGYTTRPNYNTDIKTVRLPIFKNDTYIKGIEFELTEALIREIELKTPYRVVPGWQNADTELTGTIVGGSKAVVLFNQLGEIRDAETTLTVQIAWRDLRLGMLGDGLTNPLYQQTAPGVTPGMPGFEPGQITDEGLPLGVPISPYSVAPGTVPPPDVLSGPAAKGGPLAPPPEQKDKVLVQSMASFRPELGESITTSRDKMVKRMARQIVQMMEKPY